MKEGGYLGSSFAIFPQPGRPSCRAVVCVGVAVWLLAPAWPAGAQPFFGTPVSLGDPVNEGWNAGGSMTADLLQIYFHSERPGGVGDMDIWFAKRESTDVPFDEVENPGPPVNSATSEGVPYLTPDGLQLYFSSRRPGSLPGGAYGDIWVASRESVDHPFDREPVRLPEPVNTAAQGEEMGCISSDGLQLWFFIIRGFSPSDLWVAARESRDQDWSESVVLNPGEELNAFGSFPRLSPDGRWLFLSDYNHARPGSRGLDLYIARRDDPADPLGFGAPENLEAINTDYNETCPWISPDGRFLLFASGRLGRGGFDHFLVEVVLFPPPARVTRDVQTVLSPEEHCGDFQEGEEIPVVLTLSDIRQGGETWSAPTSVTVREVPPADWSVFEISGEGVRKGEAIEWTFSGDSLTEGKTLSYRVRADTSDPTVSFSGTIEEDLPEGELHLLHPIEGDTEVIRNTPFDDCGGIRCWNILGAIRHPYGAPSEEAMRRDYLTDGTLTELDFVFEPGATISPAFSSDSAGQGIHEDLKGRNPNRLAGEMQVFAWNDTDSVIDLNDTIFGPDPNNVMAYAQAYVTSEQEMDAFLDVSSDEAIQVILNGEEAHIHSIRRGGSDDCHPQDVGIPVHLLWGENSLLVKIFDHRSLWNFALRFSDQNGDPITEGLQVWKTPPGHVCRAAPFRATRAVETGESFLIGNESRPAWQELGSSFTVTIELADIREDLPPCGPPASVTLVETVPADWTPSNPSHGGTINGDTLTWHLAANGGGGGLPRSLSYTVETGGDLIDVEFSGAIEEPGIPSFRIVGDREVLFLPPRLPRGAGQIVIEDDFDDYGAGAECPDGWTCNAQGGLFRFDPGVTQLPGHEGRLRLACGDRDGDGVADATCAGTASSVIWNEPIDLSEHSLTAEFDVYFSVPDDTQMPGDGMTFCLLDAHMSATTSLGSGGGFLGYGGLSGLAVELDLFRNGWDPSGYDDLSRPCGHIGLVRDGVFVPHVQTHLDLDPDMFPESLGGGGFPEFVDLGGTGFPLHVKVDYNNGHVAVYLSAPETGGELAFGPTKVIDTVVTFPMLLDLGAELPVLQSAFIGFTAGTGLVWSAHEVDNVVVTLHEEGPALEVCDNDLDDDGDGETDCHDDDCSGAVECVTRFVRADANADGSVDLSDGVFVLNFLFLGGAAPPCLEAANSNGDGSDEIDISDGIYVLNFLFLGGSAPPAPHPVCGRPADEILGCESFPPCP